MENNVIQRIKKLMKYYNISENSLADKLNISQSTLNSALKQGRDSINSKILEGIVDLFPDANEKWLLCGKGEMLNDNGGFVDVPDEEVINLNPKPGEKVTMVPLINIDSVGSMDRTNSLTWRDQYVVREIPFIDARPDDVAIYQSGDSMTPGIPSGSILHIRQVHDWQEYFGYGDTFVLWLKDERRITKQVVKYKPDPQNYVTCHSFNPAFEDEELPKKFIRQVWKVITVLSDKGW